uniref:Neur_chan_LBD domain-containing protein n=1 Tax=Angiostrongylus cantonensis TaxID=6313 RepID=A0A0K0DFB6_ANGCA
MSSSTDDYDHWFQSNRRHTSELSNDLEDEYRVNLRRSLGIPPYSENGNTTFFNRTFLAQLMEERQVFIKKLDSGAFLNDQRRLVDDLLDSEYYEKNVHPRDERSQSIIVNVWMVQKWFDEFLDWDPREYGMLNKTIVPYDQIWTPDTYLYNSETLARKKTESMMNAILETGFWANDSRGARVQLMFPAIYKLSCAMNVSDSNGKIRISNFYDGRGSSSPIEYVFGLLVLEVKTKKKSFTAEAADHFQVQWFPYDSQNCTFVISSWTHDKATIDYWATHPIVNLKNMARNDEWDVLEFEFERVESFLLEFCTIVSLSFQQMFKCCVNPWVILYAHLVIRRKPLYYVVNLVRFFLLYNHKFFQL